MDNELGVGKPCSWLRVFSSLANQGICLPPPLSPLVLSDLASQRKPEQVQVWVKEGYAPRAASPEYPVHVCPPSGRWTQSQTISTKSLSHESGPTPVCLFSFGNTQGHILRNVEVENISKRKARGKPRTHPHPQPPSSILGCRAVEAALLSFADCRGAGPASSPPLLGPA